MFSGAMDRAPGPDAAERLGASSSSARDDRLADTHVRGLYAEGDVRSVSLALARVSRAGISMVP
jgi:hypothetical protein